MTSRQPAKGLYVYCSARYFSLQLTVEAWVNVLAVYFVKVFSAEVLVPMDHVVTQYLQNGRFEDEIYPRHSYDDRKEEHTCTSVEG